MQNFFSLKDECGEKIVLGLMAVALLIGLAHEGFLVGRWLAVAFHHS